MAEEKKKSQVEDINRSIYDVKDKVEYSYKADKGLTEDVIREISREKDEPEWMLEKRVTGTKKERIVSALFPYLLYPGPGQ